jgi:hypothetical protein
MVIVFAALIPDNPSAAKGAAVGLFTYIAFFGATWLPLPWLYPAEVNPVKTRGKANAVSTCTNVRISASTAKYPANMTSGCLISSWS